GGEVIEVGGEPVGSVGGHGLDDGALGGLAALEVAGSVGGSGHGAGDGAEGIKEIRAGLDAFVADPPSVVTNILFAGESGSGSPDRHLRGGDVMLEIVGDGGGGGGAADQQAVRRVVDAITQGVVERSGGDGKSENGGGGIEVSGGFAAADQPDGAGVGLGEIVVEEATGSGVKGGGVVAVVGGAVGVAPSAGPVAVARERGVGPIVVHIGKHVRAGRSGIGEFAAVDVVLVVKVKGRRSDGDGGGQDDVGAGGDPLVGAGGLLELAERDVERHERVLPGLGLELAVGGDLGLDASQRGQADEDQHQKRDQRDGDEQGEAALTVRGDGGRGFHVGEDDHRTRRPGSAED